VTDLIEANYVGIDTHASTHVAAVIDQRQRVLSTIEVTADPAGMDQLRQWISRIGPVARAGIEGTSSYGAWVTVIVLDAGIEVVEVTRPNRQRRRSTGKNDTLDAVAAAVAALTRIGTAPVKYRSSHLDQLRACQIARESLVSTRTKIMNQIRALTRTIPGLAALDINDLSGPHLIDALLHHKQPIPGLDPVQLLCDYWRRLGTDTEHLEHQMSLICRRYAPELLTHTGLATICCTILLLTAAGNPDRVRGEASFARLCGTAPLEASSGHTIRHRLSRAGDRQANHALWVIAAYRITHPDPTTTAFIDRLTGRHKTRRDILRILKRALVRELLPDLRLATSRLCRPHPGADPITSHPGAPEPMSRVAKPSRSDAKRP
jgi:transposase